MARLDQTLYRSANLSDNKKRRVKREENAAGEAGFKDAKTVQREVSTSDGGAA